MPDVRLGVEIDNARVVEVMPIAYGASGTMDLAAIERGQRRAVVRLYVLRGSKRHELVTIDVRDLPVFPNRRALLRLRTAVDRTGELRIRLDVEDRLYREERFDARPFMRRSPLAVAAVVLLALLIGAGVLYALWPRPDTGPPVAAPDTGAAADPSADDDAADDGGGTPGDAGTDEAPAAREPQPEPQPAAEPAEPEPQPAAEPAEWAVYFRPDSPVLNPQARSRLADIAAELAAYEDDATVTIIGHTALAGTERGRYDLSRERARNVRAFLRAQGWDADQQVQVSGVGGEQPVTRDPDRQQLNRRVEITVTPATSSP
jgi:outer membrane protein OmpA-like peptidoglycan-associated protein